jgi:hypothetical protein
MEGKHDNINAFLEFVALCQMVIINAESDVIEWKDSMNRELWEMNSYLFNNTMKSGVKNWRENSKEIYENYTKSAAIFQHFVLIQQDEKITKYIEEKLSNLYLQIDLFSKKHDLFQGDRMVLNLWFLDLRHIVFQLMETFFELLGKDAPFDPFEDDFNGLFVVSVERSNFSQAYTNNVIQFKNNSQKSFSLRNENIYDQATNKLLKIASQSAYNTQFILRLEKLYIANVKPFLQYHYEGSAKPKDYIDYLKYGVLHSSNFKADGVKAIIKDWVQKIEETLKPSKKADEPKVILTFEDMFKNKNDAEVCLSILQEIQPPVLDELNTYIGKSKGIFPLWIKLLEKNKPNLINHLSSIQYKDILNKKISGLNLSEDASEFRKVYKRLENSTIELEIKSILSRFSQEGRLGKIP